MTATSSSLGILMADHVRCSGHRIPSPATTCAAHPSPSAPPTLSFKLALALQGAPEPALFALPSADQVRLQLSPDGRPLMVVVVRGESARTLLPGLAPTWAMRRGEARGGDGSAGLDALRRRFGTLLGRLEEVKAEQPGVSQGEEMEGAAGEEWEFEVVKGRDKAGRRAWWFEGVELRGE